MIIIRFIILKNPKAKVIQTELKLIYKTDVYHLMIVKKFDIHFLQRKIAFFNDSKSERFLTHDFIEIIHFIIAKGSLNSCKIICKFLKIAKVMCSQIFHNNLKTHRS
jgi:hypothetical protein